MLSVLSLPMIGAFPLFFEVRACAQGPLSPKYSAKVSVDHDARHAANPDRDVEVLRWSCAATKHFSCPVARRGHTPHYCFSLNGLLRPEDTCKG